MVTGCWRAGTAGTSTADRCLDQSIGEWSPHQCHSQRADLQCHSQWADRFTISTIRSIMGMILLQWNYWQSVLTCDFSLSIVICMLICNYTASCFTNSFKLALFKICRLFMATVSTSRLTAMLMTFSLWYLERPTSWPQPVLMERYVTYSGNFSPAYLVKFLWMDVLINFADWGKSTKLLAH